LLDWAGPAAKNVRSIDLWFKRRCPVEPSDTGEVPEQQPRVPLSRKALSWRAKHLFTLVWERLSFPKPARPTSLLVQGGNSGLESTRRQASRGEGHHEHLEIQEEVSDHRVNASTTQDEHHQQPLKSARGDTETNRQTSPPAVLNKTKINPQISFECCAFSYKFGGTNPQSTELAARISKRADQPNQFCTLPEGITPQFCAACGRLRGRDNALALRKNF